MIIVSTKENGTFYIDEKTLEVYLDRRMTTVAIDVPEEVLNIAKKYGKIEEEAAMRLPKRRRTRRRARTLEEEDPILVTSGGGEVIENPTEDIVEEAKRLEI